ncbi:hypothetical protein WJX81_007537 [Elliptochloris bilobata]|uniref:Mediator of RNA polymerase II transcription subunit 31 n=1 Tax=Elliptochloris bilobata TaxID=381761 RepID=A0AAW1QW53_9CHLO
MTTSLDSAEALRRVGSEETGCSDQQRFSLELEFVQCLANPHYLNWLSQNRYFDEPAFIKYLDYLQYWRQPHYARFLTYPHALFFLDLMQSPDFRTAIGQAAVKEMVHSQQFYFWQHFRANRLKS